MTSKTEKHEATTATAQIEGVEEKDEKSILDMVNQYRTSETLSAYEIVKDKLIIIPSEELLLLRFEAAEATARGLWLAGNAERDLELFMAFYKNPPVEEIRSMNTRSLAIKGAENASVPTIKPPDFERARFLRQLHQKVVEAVGFQNPEIMEKLGKILPGRGYQDLGSDLIDYVKLETQHWNLFGSTGLLTRKLLEESESLGLRILQWSQRHDEQKPNPREAEQRAWTYMARAYHHIRIFASPIYLNDRETWRRDYPNLFTRGPLPRRDSKDKDRGVVAVTSEPEDRTEPIDGPTPPPGE